MTGWARQRWRGFAAFATVTVLAAAFGLYWFAPWKLFTDHTVNEALPAAALIVTAPSPPPPGAAESSRPGSPSTPTIAAPAPQLLASGELISHEHATHGTVSVVAQPDGSRVLALADLDTSNGPDLHVWLATAPLRSGSAGWYIFDDAEYEHISLGPLKGNLGNQVYPIPAGADLARFSTVTIWCDRFNVSFGAAGLKPA